MSYAAQILRLAIAFVAGWVAYMVAAVLDVLAPVGGAEAFIGLCIQAVMGAVFTFVAIVVVGVVGLPFYLLRGRIVRIAWPMICGILAMAGVLALMASWLPANMIQVPHPDPQLSEMGQTIAVANPTLAIGGWLAMLFGIVHCTVRPIRIKQSATAT